MKLLEKYDTYKCLSISDGLMIDSIRDDNLADEADRPGDEYVKGQIRKI